MCGGGPGRRSLRKNNPGYGRGLHQYATLPKQCASFLLGDSFEAFILQVLHLGGSHLFPFIFNFTSTLSFFCTILTENWHPQPVNRVGKLLSPCHFSMSVL